MHFAPFFILQTIIFYIEILKGFHLLKRVFIIAISTAFATNCFAEDLSCNYPVKHGDSAKSIKARFGKNAIIDTIYLPEGETTKGIVLYPKNKLKRIEILFDDEEMTRVGSVTVRTDKSDWKLKGLTNSDRLNKAVAINGAPISMSGFDWDYGGYTGDFHKGKLSGTKTCQYGLRFELPENATDFDNIIGDISISSNDKAVKRNNPLISEMYVEYSY